MAEFSNLKDHFRESADELSNLLRMSHNLSSEMQKQQNDMLRLSATGQNVIAAYKAMQTNAQAISKEWETHHRISAKLIQDYGTQAQAINKLKQQYAELERVQKVLDLASKSASEKMQLAFDTMGKVSGGAVGLVARLTTLGLTYDHLKSTLLDYNRSAFEGMRIGERYGDSTTKLTSALKAVSSQTALSQQDFVDLNLAVKQLSVGLPMTSEAVQKFAATLSNKLGWSAEQVKKGMMDLIPLQNKLPSLFDRITKAQNDQSGSAVKAAASVKMLTDKLYAMGASRAEVEGVLNTITKPKFEFDKWMGFEKTIAKSKQSIQDVNLEIANKMQRGLEMVAKTQAAISKMINVLPSAIMMATAGFALMGVAVGKVLFQLSQVAGIMKMLPAYAAATTAGLDKGTLKDFGKGMGRGVLAVGATVAPMIGTAVGDWGSSKYLGSTADYDPSKGAPKGGGRWGAAAIEGGANAVGLGATGAYYGGMFGKKGRAIGAGIGAFAGLIGGGIKGYMKGGDAEAEQTAKQKEYLETQAAGASQMGMAARGAEVGVKEGSSQKEILAAVRQEVDLEKQKAAYEALYRMGAVKSGEVTQGILQNVKDEVKAREATESIVTKVLSGVNGIQDVERQIERSVEGQTQELEAQIQIYNKLADVGKAAASSLEAGTLGTEMANRLMDQGMEGYRQQAAAVGKQAVLAYVKAFSDNEDVMKNLNPMEQMSAGQIKSAEDTVKAQAMKIDSMQGNAAPEAIQKEREELAKLTDQMTKMEAKADFTKAFNMGDVNKGIEEINEKIKKLHEEQAAGNKQTYDAKNGWQDIDTVLDGLLSKQGQLVDLSGKYAAILAGPINQAFTNVTAGTKREIGMQDQLLGLGEARLALAEKMGLPQSYSALKNQVALTYQQYQNNEKVVAQQAQVVKQLEAQYQTTIDVQSVLNGTKTIEQVIGEAKEKSLGTAKMTGEAEVAAVAAIKNQVGATTQMVNLEGKLAELTKTWREGWLDAMEETVINAGDFTAVIGMGGKNVPEAIAAGRPDTFRYGGVNRQAMDAYQARELQGTPALRFTDVQMQMNRDVQNDNPLMRHTNVTSWNPGQSVAAAAAGYAPMLETGPLSAAGVQAQVEENMRTGGSRIITPGATGPMRPGEYGAAGNRTLGVQQPGGPSTGLPNPTIVNPVFTNLDSAAGDLKGAAANLNEAVGKLHGKAGGGIVKAAGGGLLRLQTGGEAGMSKTAAAAGMIGVTGAGIAGGVGLAMLDKKLRRKMMHEEYAEAAKHAQKQLGMPAHSNAIEAEFTDLGTHAVKPSTAMMKPRARMPIKTAPRSRGYMGRGAGISLAAGIAGEYMQQSGNKNVRGAGHAVEIAGEALGLYTTVAGASATYGATTAIGAVGSAAIMPIIAAGAAGAGVGYAVDKAFGTSDAISALYNDKSEAQLREEQKISGESAAMRKQLIARTAPKKQDEKVKAYEKAQRANERAANSARVSQAAGAGGYQNGYADLIKAHPTLSSRSIISGIVGMEKSTAITDPKEREAAMAGYSDSTRASIAKVTELEERLNRKDLTDSQRDLIQSLRDVAMINRTNAFASEVATSAGKKEQAEADAKTQSAGAAKAMEAQAKQKALASLDKHKIGTYDTPYGLVRMSGKGEAEYVNGRAKTKAPAPEPVMIDGRLKPGAMGDGRGVDARGVSNPSLGSISPDEYLEHIRKSKGIVSPEEGLAKIRAYKLEEEYKTFNAPVNVNEKLAAASVPSNRLEGRGGSNRLEGRGPSGRLERRADGGGIASGSFIVKASQAAGAAGIPGVGYVTGGTPGRDSVMFDVLAGGGSPSGTQALLMPGEAIVPPAYAGIGQAINSGIMAFEDGGVAAARDIAMAAPRGGGSGGGGGGVTHTFELSEDVKNFLRLPSGTQQNGTMP